MNGKPKEVPEGARQPPATSDAGGRGLDDLLAEFVAPKAEPEEKAPEAVGEPEEAPPIERREPTEEEFFEALTAGLTEEDARRRAASTLNTRREYAQERGDLHAHQIKNQYNHPVREQVEADAREALRMSSTEFVPWGSQKEKDLNTEIARRLEQVIPAEQARVTSLRLAEVLIHDTHNRLAAKMRINRYQEMHRGGKLSGEGRYSTSWFSGDLAGLGQKSDAFDRLSATKQAELLRMEAEAEEMELAALGRLALERENASIAALPILLVTGQLEDEEVLAALRVRLSDLGEEDRDRQQQWLSVLRECRRIQEEGGRLVFEDRRGGRQVFVTITPGGETELGAGSSMVNPRPAYLQETTAEGVILRMLREAKLEE